jgi:hypothetical protein
VAAPIGIPPSELVPPLPIVEIVDSKEKIDELMPHIDERVQEGLVTLERVQVIKYRAGDATNR